MAADSHQPNMLNRRSNRSLAPAAGYPPPASGRRPAWATLPGGLGKWTCCAVVALALTTTTPVRAQDAAGPPDRPLRLRGGDVHLPRADRASHRTDQPISGAFRHVLQVTGPLTAEQRAALQSAGVVLDDYLPDWAWIADLRHADRAALAKLDFVSAVEPFRREWKVDPPLAWRAAGSGLRSPGWWQPPPGVRTYHTPERAALNAEGKFQVLLATFRGVGRHEIEQALEDITDLEVVGMAASRNRVYVDAILPVNALAALVDGDLVQFVEEAPEATLRNAVTAPVVQSGTNTDTPLWDNGLHGEDQIIGLIDGTPNFAHCMFTDSEPIGPAHRKFVAARNASTSNSHGTHTAGTLAGDNSPYNDYNLNDGQAYAARISFSNYYSVSASPSTFLARLVDANTDGARVHSNSWGDDGTTAYTLWCSQADEFSHDYEDNLVCFACTNTSALKTPENAKNVLAVGATQQYPNHDNHCYGGQGPTFDGRRKPEIYAPGCSIMSADSSTSCGVRSSSGASMACPAIAALATLARQYYVEGYWPIGLPTPADTRTPTGALLRATLLNAAVDMTGIPGYPSNKEGWGRLVLDRSLYFNGDRRRLIVIDTWNADGLETGELFTLQFTCWSDLEDLRVTMVFTDPPAAVNSSVPVINDLDLTVSGPLGGVPDAALYRGNYYVGGQSATGGTADPLNNVEQIYLAVPEAGVYTVQVAGTAVNSGPQGFALVVTGRVSDGVNTPWRGFGDYDGDGDKDLVDFAALQLCYSGPDATPEDPGCAVFDIEGDTDVDLQDYTVFETALHGP